MSAEPTSSKIETTRLALRTVNFEVLQHDHEHPLPPPRFRYGVEARGGDDVVHATVTLETVDESPVFRLSASMVFDFSFEAGASVSPREFADRHVRVYAWPFFRELVLNLTMRSGLPPLYLPISNFVAETDDRESA